MRLNPISRSHDLSEAVSTIVSKDVVGALTMYAEGPLFRMSRVGYRVVYSVRPCAKTKEFSRSCALHALAMRSESPPALPQRQLYGSTLSLWARPAPCSPAKTQCVCGCAHVRV